MKKLLIAIFAVAILIVMALFLVTKISDSYALAKETIGRSSVVTNTVGQVTFAALLGARHNLQPKSVSCGSMLFFVKGTRDSEFVEVLVSKEDFHGQWTVYDIVLGMTNRSEKSCPAKAPE
jgi:hypothetical protein